MIWSLIWAPVWLFILHPWWKIRAPQGAAWVISGHRGRAYGDNAAALHAAAQAAGRRVFWLSNSEMLEELTSRGVRVLRRHSWAARRAISQAPVLIYSHGEDDLDLALICLRGRTGTRVYLNHCLNLLKAGGVMEPGWHSKNVLTRTMRTWLLTDADIVLYASEVERETLSQSYPFLSHKMQPGGGAHLDEWQASMSQEPKRRIYWFPTFRESEGAQACLAAVIQLVIENTRLAVWLKQHDYELWIGSHINQRVTQELNVHKPFQLRGLASLVADIRESELLVSDYSGLIFDYLLLERPQINFAFDQIDYLKGRHLYHELDSLDFALPVRNVEQLVEAIVLERWREPHLRQAASKWKSKCFPIPCDSYSLASLHAIEQHLKRAS